MVEELDRIHITGGPGSGKTRLAQRLTKLRSIPKHDLDGLLLGVGDDALMSGDASVADLDAEGAISRLAGMPEWVSEGVYFNWTEPFLESADVIVWLDPPWRVASYRIIARHVRLELARQNRFPGWKRLYSFWRWAARFYADTNEHTINRYGAPNTRLVLEAGLEPYRNKIIVCRTNKDIERFVEPTPSTRG